jgi:uncharacterized Fe-S center protein
MVYSERVVLHFPKELVNQPLIHELVKKFDIQFNILKAQVTQEEDGLMVLGLSGTQKSVAEATKHLKAHGVGVQPLDKDISIDKKRCTECGACVAQCPVDALSADARTACVSLDAAKCIACERCVPACFYGAIGVNFGRSELS